MLLAVGRDDQLVDLCTAFDADDLRADLHAEQCRDLDRARARRAESRLLRALLGRKRPIHARAITEDERTSVAAVGRGHGEIRRLHVGTLHHHVDLGGRRVGRIDTRHRAARRNWTGVRSRRRELAFERIGLHRQRRACAAVDVDRIGANRCANARPVGQLVQLAVAIVVHVVADFACIGVDSLDGIVAVAETRGALLAARAARVHHVLVAETVGVVVATFVDIGVTLVIETIARLGRTRINGFDTIIAVVAGLGRIVRRRRRFRARRTLEDAHAGIAIVVAIVIAALVDRAVAVVVQVVADLGRNLGQVFLGVANCGTAIGGASSERAGSLADTVIVAAHAALAQIETFVGRAIALIVDAIACLGRARIDRVGCVIAVVASLGRVVRRNRRVRARRTFEDAHARVAIFVAVIVATFVGRTIARIVLAIADFGHVLVDFDANETVETAVAHVRAISARIAVVAIAGLAEIRPQVVGCAVAIIVVAIAGFDIACRFIGAFAAHATCCAGPRALLALVVVRAVARQAQIEVRAVGVLAVVRDAVAVIVHVVAKLGRCGAHVGHGIAFRTLIAGDDVALALAERGLQHRTRLEVMHAEAGTLGDRRFRPFARIDRPIDIVIAVDRVRARHKRTAQRPELVVRVAADIVREHNRPHERLAVADLALAAGAVERRIGNLARVLLVRRRIHRQPTVLGLELRPILRGRSRSRGVRTRTGEHRQHHQQRRQEIFPHDELHLLSPWSGTRRFGDVEIDNSPNGAAFFNTKPFRKSSEK